MKKKNEEKHSAYKQTRMFTDSHQLYVHTITVVTAAVEVLFYIHCKINEEELYFNGNE